MRNARRALAKLTAEEIQTILREHAVPVAPCRCGSSLVAIAKANPAAAAGAVIGGLIGALTPGIVTPTATGALPLPPWVRKP